VTDIDPARSPMILLDTHVLVWLMLGDHQLGEEARGVIRRACGEDRVAVSAITPWEIGILVSKKRIDLYRDVMDWVREALSLPGVHLTPLSAEIAVASARLPWEMHADPADRILVATARNQGATLMTADRALLGMAGNGHFAALDAMV
jgi:PIN domain nuclease of toxin-antitoxin system